MAREGQAVRGPRRQTFAERQAAAAKARAEAQERNRQELADRAAAQASVGMARSILAGFAISDGGTVRAVNESDVAGLGAWVHGGGGRARIIVLPSAAEGMSPADFAGRGSLYQTTVGGGARRAVVLDYAGNMEAPEGAEVHQLSDIVARHQRAQSHSQGEPVELPERTLEQRGEYLLGLLAHTNLREEDKAKVRDAVKMGDLRFLQELRISRHALADAATGSTRNHWVLSRWPDPTPPGVAQTRTLADLLTRADQRWETAETYRDDPAVGEVLAAGNQQDI